jgi:hypothetical protein
MKNLISLLILLFLQTIGLNLLGQDCSKKYLREDGALYIRRMFFPWYAAGEGWETRVTAGIRDLSIKGVQAWVGFYPANEKGRVIYFPDSISDPIFKGSIGRIFFPVPDTYDVWKGEYGNGTSVNDNRTYIRNTMTLETGVVDVSFMGNSESNPCFVNYAFDHLLNGELSYLWRDQNGIAKWQASVPGYFVDELSPRWLAPFSMSSLPPVDGRQFEDFEDPSFAIANAGDKEVIVRIRFYNNFFRPWLNSNGKPTVKDSPESINTSWYINYQEKCLTKYIRLGPMGVKAQIIRDFSKADPQNVGLCGDNPLFRNIPDGFFMVQYGYPQGTSYGYSYGFWGFILFEAVNPDGSIDKTAKIAPLVLQRVGDSLNNIPVKKLLPETTYDEFVTYHR